DVETPVGSSIEYTASKVRQVNATLMEFPEVVGSYATINAGTTTGENRATIIVSMVSPGQRERTPPEMTIPVRNALSEIPGAQFMVGAAGGFGGVTAPIQIVIYGDSFDVLDRLSGQLMARLGEIEGLFDIESSLDEAQPVLGVR